MAGRRARGRGRIAAPAGGVLACALAALGVACGAPPRAEPIDHETPGTVRAVDRDRGTRHPVDYLAAPFARAVGRLVVESSADGTRQKNCTLTLLEGERDALTARHCLFASTSGSEADAPDAAEERPLRGRYWIAFGYARGDWTERAEVVITGEDLFDRGAVRAWPRWDLAVIRLPKQITTGRLRTRHGRVDADGLRVVSRDSAMAGLRGLPLASPKRDGASRATRGQRVDGLYAYSADEEIGRRHGVLCVDAACREAVATAAPDAPDVWLDCAGYPGGSGAPYLRRTAAGVAVAGVAIEAEHESRRTRLIRTAAFRAEVEAARLEEWESSVR